MITIVDSLSQGIIDDVLTRGYVENALSQGTITDTLSYIFSDAPPVVTQWAHIYSEPQNTMYYLILL